MSSSWLFWKSNTAKAGARGRMQPRYGVAYLETQSNRVSDFRDFVCSLFQKAVLFDFYLYLTALKRSLLWVIAARICNLVGNVVSGSNNYFPNNGKDLHYCPFFQMFACTKVTSIMKVKVGKMAASILVLARMQKWEHISAKMCKYIMQRDIIFDHGVFDDFIYHVSANIFRLLRDVTTW